MLNLVNHFLVELYLLLGPTRCRGDPRPDRRRPQARWVRDDHRRADRPPRGRRAAPARAEAGVRHGHTALRRRVRAGPRRRPPDLRSTYLDSERADAEKNGHLTAAQAAEIARDAGARRLVLTHISQRYRDTEPFLDEASRLHDDVHVAEDGDVVPFPARRPQAATRKDERR